MEETTYSQGDVFEGKWRIERELGRGGFATVYDAFELSTGRAVALKIMRRLDGVYPPDVVGRFRRELRALGKLDSPFTVRMYVGGESNDGSFYAVFERLRGRPLSAVLNERGRLPAAEVRQILSQMLEALEEAHRHGILHRDIKPENIILLPDGQAKLIDFGLARPLDVRAPSVTMTGELVGTPRYMSPEQLTERPLTPASDVYSLGLVAFELLVGRDGLHGNAWGDQLVRLHPDHVFQLPAHDGLEHVIAKMTAGAPAQRFQTAAQVLAALRHPEPRALEVPPSSSPRIPWVVGAVSIAALVAAYVFSSPDSQPVKRPPASVPRTVVHSTTPTVSDPPPQKLRSLCDERAQTGFIEGDGYVLYAPRATSPRPLVLLLHDRFDRADDLLRGSKWSQLADEEGVFVVAPQSWEVKSIRRSTPLTDPWKDETQIAHAQSVLREVSQNHCVDFDQLYLVGHGFGGRGAEELACSGDWAGVATVASLGYAPFSLCNREDPRTRRLRVLKIAGRGDHILSLFGGPDRCTRISGTVTWNDLDAQWSTALEAPDVDDARPFSRGEREERCRTWSAGSEVRYKSCLYNIGHRWPGFAPRPRSLEQDHEVCDGVETPADFELEKLIWDFFEADADPPSWHSAGCFKSIASVAPANMHWPKDHTGPLPLVLLFHQSAVDNLQFLRDSGFVALAEEKGFAVLSLAGQPMASILHNPWKGPAHMKQVEREVKGILDEHCIDRRRVYAVGHGVGGRAAQAIACDDIVAATATFGHRGEEYDCRSPRAIPRLQINPTNSGHTPVFGGTVCGGTQKLAPLNTYDDELAATLDCDAGTAPFEERREPQERRWECRGEPFVSQLVVGGQGWPGVQRKPGGDPHGCDRGAPNVDLARRIWDFFETEAQPE